MRGVYTAKIKLTALAAAKTLILIEAPSTKVVEILSARVTNSSNGTNQQIECVIRRVTTLGSPAGTALTPTPHEPGDQASGSTVLGGLTTEPTTYNASGDVGDMGFSSLAGYFFQPMPEERPIISAGGSAGLYLATAPTAMDTEAEITYREIG